VTAKSNFLILSFSSWPLAKEWYARRLLPAKKHGTKTSSKMVAPMLSQVAKH